MAPERELRHRMIPVRINATRSYWTLTIKRNRGSMEGVSVICTKIGFGSSRRLPEALGTLNLASPVCLCQCAKKSKSDSPTSCWLLVRVLAVRTDHSATAGQWLSHSSGHDRRNYLLHSAVISIDKKEAIEDRSLVYRGRLSAIFLSGYDQFSRWFWRFRELIKVFLLSSTHEMIMLSTSAAFV